MHRVCLNAGDVSKTVYLDTLPSVGENIRVQNTTYAILRCDTDHDDPDERHVYKVSLVETRLCFPKIACADALNRYVCSQMDPARISFKDMEACLRQHGLGNTEIAYVKDMRDHQQYSGAFDFVIEPHETYIERH